MDNWSIVPQNFGGWLATATTFILGLLMWHTQVKRGKVDESAVVLAEWKKLLDVHQAQIKALTDEIHVLRVRLNEAENRIRLLEDENTALKRAIAQNSQASAMLIGKHSRRVDRLVSDRTASDKQVNEHLDRLDKGRDK